MNCQGWHVCAIKPANTFNKVFKRFCTWLGHVKVLTQRTAGQKHCKQTEDCFLSGSHLHESWPLLWSLSPSYSQRTHQAQLGPASGTSHVLLLFPRMLLLPPPRLPSAQPLASFLHASTGSHLAYSLDSLRSLPQCHLFRKPSPDHLIWNNTTLPAPQFLLTPVYFIFSSLFTTWHAFRCLFVCSPR